MIARLSAASLCILLLLGLSASSRPIANPANTDSGRPSSIRWKQNVKPISGALDSVKQMRGVEFDWKKEYGGKHDIGFIAEEVGKIEPTLVEWEVDGKTAAALKYDRIPALTVEAIKAQQRQIDELRAELAKHETRLKEHGYTLTQHGDKLTSHESRLEEFSDRFCKIERSLKTMAQQIQELDEAVVALQEQPGCTCAAGGPTGAATTAP